VIIIGTTCGCVEARRQHHVPRGPAEAIKVRVQRSTRKPPPAFVLKLERWWGSHSRFLPRFVLCCCFCFCCGPIGAIAARHSCCLFLLSDALVAPGFLVFHRCRRRRAPTTPVGCFSTLLVEGSTSPWLG
jgi:hypothetical protein